MGIEERTAAFKKWREDDKVKKEKADKLREEVMIKNGLRGITEVDTNFVEEDFDSALGKLIEMCRVFDARNAGPGFRRIFETNFFTPGEFKEILKRTFNVRVTSAELGVLLAYFDTSMSGNITTSSFMSSFLKIRINLEDIKGKVNEKTLLKEYHQKMKIAYKKRIERLTSLTNDNALKPWRANLPVTMFDRKQHKPYPKSAAHKLRRRLNLGLRTGRLDLATQLLWHQSDVKVINTEDMTIAGDTVENSQGALAEEMKEDVKNIMKRSSGMDLVAQGKSKLQLKVQQDLSNLSALISFSLTEKRSKEDRVVRNLAQKPPEDCDIQTMMISGRQDDVSINFRISSIPSEVFNMLSLRELWLCNNELGVIPSYIGELKCLQVLSLAGNKLQTIPPEICLVESLKRLYLERNDLEKLPELFGRLHNLTSLNISVNQFEIFPEVACSLKSLINLDVESNKISSLPSSLRSMKSLVRLNLADNLIYSPDAALSKMWWLSVIPSCAIMKTENSASIFKVSVEESLASESFLRNKARARSARIQFEQKYKRENGIEYVKPKKAYEKIIMK
jgi:Leucine-rich repeat (LRR) protein